MGSLEEILGKIKSNRAVVASEKTIHEVENPHSLRMKRGFIKKAKEDLIQLYREYRTEIRGRAAFIVVTGDKSDKFAEKAESDFGCFSVNADDFYNDIAEQVPEQLWKGKSSSPSLFDFFLAKFEDRAHEIEIVNFPHLTFESKYKKMIKDQKDLVSLMKTAFNEKIGGEVVGYDAIDKATEKGIEKEYAGRTAAIVLYSKDEGLAKTLTTDLSRITSNVFLVVSGKAEDESLEKKAIGAFKSPTQSNIEKTLVSVKDNLR